jgi:hypothetical protein
MPETGSVVARLHPAIHVLLRGFKDVDARHKAGHDDLTARVEFGL